jgi:hypothetical protein
MASLRISIILEWLKLIDEQPLAACERIVEGRRAARRNQKLVFLCPTKSQDIHNRQYPSAGSAPAPLLACRKSAYSDFTDIPTEPLDRSESIISQQKQHTLTFHSMRN